MGWFRQNIVLVTMVPFIISFHYGWMYLQSMDELNKGGHKPLTEQPIITVNYRVYNGIIFFHVLLNHLLNIFFILTEFQATRKFYHMLTNQDEDKKKEIKSDEK